MQCLKDGFIQNSLKTVGFLVQSHGIANSELSFCSACEFKDHSGVEHLFLVCRARCRTWNGDRPFLRNNRCQPDSNGRLHQENYRSAITANTHYSYTACIRASPFTPSTPVQHFTGQERPDTSLWCGPHERLPPRPWSPLQIAHRICGWTGYSRKVVEEGTCRS